MTEDGDLLASGFMIDGDSSWSPLVTHMSYSNMKSTERLPTLAPSCAMTAHKEPTSERGGWADRLECRLFRAPDTLVDLPATLVGDTERQRGRGEGR
jgi:hypothetical protein